MAAVLLAAVASAAVAGALSAALLWSLLPAKTVVEERNYTIPAKIEMIIVYDNSSEAGLEERLEAAITKAAPSVVHISGATQRQLLIGSSKSTVTAGSGFIASPDGYVLTNAHVVEGMANVTVLVFDGGAYAGEVMGTDASTDLAVVKIASNGSFTPAEFGDSEKVTLGQFVLALGSPYRLTNSATLGVISGLNRTFTMEDDSQVHEVIQTDAAINPGNSGGPLIDLEGRVVGVNSALISKSGGFEGIGFAIPSNLAKNITFELIAKGKISRPWMGITMRTVTNETAALFNLTVKSGALILDVVTASPAETAGLKGTLVKRDLSEAVPGDVVVSLGGRPVATTGDLIEELNRHMPGENLTLGFVRNGTAYETAFTVGEKPSKP
jgi:serine protease Do